MKRHTPRTRFGDIVAEFMPPASRRARRRPSRVVILCGGMPGAPSRGALVEFFSRKGFWCFSLRYRGTWESGGKFLRVSPADDVRIVMDGLARGFRDSFSGKHYHITASEIFLFGTSFGGPAVILNSRDPRVRRVVALSPVVDWRARSSEPLGWMERFVRRAFGDAYRFSHRDWMKLASGSFYNPVSAPGNMDGKKIMIVHAKSDRIAPFAPARAFAVKTGATLVTLARGGHFSSSIITKPAVWKKIRGFLDGSPTGGGKRLRRRR